MTIKTLIFVYNSIIYPNLYYCCSVWGSCPKSILDPLIKIQKKIVRVMSFKPMYHPTHELFKRLNILTVPKINTYSSLSYTFKLLQSGHEWFQPYNSHINTRGSARSTLVLPPIMTNNSRQSVRWVGATLWNSLPECIKEQETYNSFKYKLKRYLINDV